MKPGVRLLAACREILATHQEQLKCQSVFISTATLIADLVGRTEEPWATYIRGHRITPEALANLLRKYGIRPEMNAQRTGRGYVSARFEDAWARYLPPPPSEIPSNPSSPSSPWSWRRPTYANATIPIATLRFAGGRGVRRT
jgi:hypothetical protein